MWVPLNSPDKAPALQAWKMKFSASLLRIRPCIYLAQSSMAEQLPSLHMSLFLCPATMLIKSLLRLKDPVETSLSSWTILFPTVLNNVSFIFYFLVLFFKWLCYHNYHLTHELLISSSALPNVQLFFYFFYFLFLKDTKPCISLYFPLG